MLEVDQSTLPNVSRLIKQTVEVLLNIPSTSSNAPVATDGNTVLSEDSVPITSEYLRSIMTNQLTKIQDIPAISRGITNLLSNT
jgi:hypothetical protein